MSSPLRIACRHLLRNPGFTLVAVLTLALALAVNTTMFSALQATILRPVPYPEPERLVRVFRTSPHSRSWPHSGPNFLDLQARNRVFDRLAAVVPQAFSLAEVGHLAERVRGLRVTVDYLPMLGFQPLLGRLFRPEEGLSGGAPVAVVSERLWRERFRADPEVVGRVVRLDGAPVTVVGVMPEAVVDTRFFGRADLWRPLALGDGRHPHRGDNWLQAVGRLKPGVSLEQAQVEMSAIAARLGQEYPDTNGGEGIRLVRLADSTNASDRQVLGLVMALAGFVLLIACANLANLQVSRTLGRSRELAIRGALGAPRSRLLRDLLLESLLIAVFGGLLGLVLASWGNAWMTSRIPNGGDSSLRVSLRPMVLVFAVLATSFAGLAFGLVPAWLASATELMEALRQRSQGATGHRVHQRLRQGLVVAQVALALVLVSGAGVVTLGVRRFVERDPGWRLDDLSVGSIELPAARYGSAPLQRGIAARLQQALEGVAGVEAVALAGSLPVEGFDVETSFGVEGRPDPRPGQETIASVNAVTPGYVAALGMRLVEGREFSRADDAGHPRVVLVNERMAHALWPGESAVGRRIGSPGQWMDVVGVVNDVGYPATLDRAPSVFQIYRPFAQDPRDSLVIALRGRITTATLREVLAGLDADLVLGDPGPVRGIVDRRLGGSRLIGGMLGGFAGLGLLLAGLGLYGVMAGFVAQRTHEIGVRLALGAQVRTVLWLVLGKGMGMTVVGLVIGLVGAWMVVRFLGSVSAELSFPSPWLLAGVAVPVVAVALLASWLPARRATRVDPLTALRSD